MSVEEYDVIVVGYGGAGASAAVAACDAGARVLLLERSEAPGGNTKASAGSLRLVDERDSAVQYLVELSGGTVPASIYDTFIAGIPETFAWLESEGAHIMTPTDGWLIGFPPVRTQTFGEGTASNGLGPRARVELQENEFGGEALWRVLESAVARRDIVVELGTRVRHLTFAEHGVVDGVEVESADGPRKLRARGGVVLATGGFGADPEMQVEYLGCSFVSMAPPNRNSGDGVRMAQSAGASLWHMTAFSTVLGYDLPGHDVGVQHRMRTANFIYVDQSGRRFVNETGWDFHALPLTFLERDHHSGHFPRIPSFAIFDDTCRSAGPIVYDRSRTAKDVGWSDDNLREVELGWIKTAPTIEELAEQIGLPRDQLVATVSRWNDGCVSGLDPQFDRASADLGAVARPPFYAISLWPLVVNTQGGPRRDEHARVLDPFGEPISGLYAAGELGSIWTQRYPGAGNVTEALVFGRIAGREAARSAR